MRKLIPTIFTALRLLCALAIYFVIGTAWVLPLFIIGGVSDALDGFLARRLKAQTRIGAILDSVADYAFFGSIPVWLLMSFQEKSAELLPPIVLVALVSIPYFIVRFFSKKTFYHLYTAKLGAVTSFFAGALILGGYAEIWPLWVAACVVVLAEIEEIAIIAGINEVRR